MDDSVNSRLTDLQDGTMFAIALRYQNVYIN